MRVPFDGLTKGTQMPELETLQDLFVEQLRDLYSAETQISKALPKMAKAATTPQLRMAFEKHLKETLMQKDRVAKIAEMLEVKPGGHLCAATKGLIEEATEFLEDSKKSPKPIRDAGLISNAQRVEHYEIAGYGTALALAQKLGLDKAAKLLEQTLNEEKATDEKLTTISESVNDEAALAEGEEEEDKTAR